MAMFVHFFSPCSFNSSSIIGDTLLGRNPSVNTFQLLTVQVRRPWIGIRGSRTTKILGGPGKGRPSRAELWKCACGQRLRPHLGALSGSGLASTTGYFLLMFLRDISVPRSLYGRVIFQCMDGPPFIHLWVSGWTLRLFPLFAYYGWRDSECPRTSFCVVVSSGLLGINLGVGLLSPRFDFLKNGHTVFQSSCTFPHQHCLGPRPRHILATTCHYLAGVFQPSLWMWRGISFCFWFQFP